MHLFWKSVDQLLDFQKVRYFQEVCGLAPAKQTLNTELKEIQHNEEAKNNSQYNVKRNNKEYPKFRCNIDNHNEDVSKNCHSSSNKHSYIVNNWFLYYLFRFGSLLGTEVFYITFIPLVFWNFDPYIGRKLVIVWVVTMYIGQVLKDLICWPRPSFPPVFKLETRVQAEYGIPSTHAIAGTSIPFSIVMAMKNRYLMDFQVGFLVASCFCLLVSLSRLYVGMHSILDILAGVSISAVYLLLGFPFMDLVEEYTLKATYAPLIIIISHFLLGWFYPATKHYSTSHGDTVIILATGAGIHSASWLLHKLDICFSPVGTSPYAIPIPTINSFLVGFCRAFVGIVILALARLIVKKLSVSIVCHIAGVSKQDDSVIRKRGIEASYKFITYFILGFTVVATVPLVLQKLNIVY